MGYLVEIIGSNRASGFYTLESGTIVCSNNQSTFDPIPVTLYDSGETAVFGSKKEANTIGLGIRWNNQRIRIRRTRQAANV